MNTEEQEKGIRDDEQGKDTTASGQDHKLQDNRNTNNDDNGLRFDRCYKCGYRFWDSGNLLKDVIVFFA